MAIDTTGKKLSLLNYMRTDMIVLPEGNGSFSEGDKLNFLNLYSFGLGEGGPLFSHILLFLLNINRLNALILKLEQTTTFVLEKNEVITFNLER